MSAHIRINTDTYFEDEPEVGIGLEHKAYIFNSFSVVGENEYRDLTVKFEPEPGKAYVLLYVTYTNGDSETTRYGNIEYVDLYEVRNIGIAEDNKRRILIHAEAFDKSKLSPGDGVKILTNEGTEYKTNPPWEGIFEKIESVEIKILTLEENC